MGHFLRGSFLVMFEMKKITPWSFFFKIIKLFYSLGEGHYSTSKNDPHSLFYGGSLFFVWRWVTTLSNRCVSKLWFATKFWLVHLNRPTDISKHACLQHDANTWNINAGERKLKNEMKLHLLKIKVIREQAMKTYMCKWC